MSSEYETPFSPDGKPSPRPAVTKASFFAGFTLLLASLFPYLMAIGVLPVYLPPWAQKMTELWGPAFILLAVFVFLLLRYVPANAWGSFVGVYEQTAVALGALSATLNTMGIELRTLSSVTQEMVQVVRQLHERMIHIEEDQKWLFRHQLGRNEGENEEATTR